MGLVLQTVLNALILSGWYALIASGFSFLFGVMGIANFAHGEFFMLGAYAVWILYSLNHWPFFIATIMAFLLVSGVGVLCELAFFRRMRGDLIGGFLMSLGIMFCLQVGVAETWGVGMPKKVVPPLSETLRILGTVVSWQRFLVLPVGIVTIVLFLLFLARTRMGRAFRASAEDSEAASLMGINANKIGIFAMALASGMAGLAGALMAPLMPVTPYMGHYVIDMCFIIVVIGGAGSMKGTLLACVIIAFLTTIVSTVFDTTISFIINDIVMLILLGIRPQGLFGYEKK